MGAMITTLSAQPHFLFYVAKYKSKKVGYIIGHAKESGEFYIDFIGILPQYRKKRKLATVLLAILFFLKMRLLPSVESKILNALFQQVVASALFLVIFQDAYNRGFRKFSARTIAKANNVRALFNLAGFKQVAEEKNRVIVSFSL
jgi:hypothetical protein